VRMGFKYAGGVPVVPPCIVEGAPSVSIRFASEILLGVFHNNKRVSTIGSAGRLERSHSSLKIASPRRPLWQVSRSCVRLESCWNQPSVIPEISKLKPMTISRGCDRFFEQWRQHRPTSMSFTDLKCKSAAFGRGRTDADGWLVACLEAA